MGDYLSMRTIIDCWNAFSGGGTKYNVAESRMIVSYTVLARNVLSNNVIFICIILFDI